MHHVVENVYPQRTKKIVELTRMSRRLLASFFILQFISLTRGVLIGALGSGMNAVGLFANAGSIVVLAATIISIRRLDGGSLFAGLPRWVGAWWWSVLVFVVFESVLGLLLYGYRPDAVVQDAAAYFMVLAAVVLGGKPTVFSYTLRVLFWTLCAGLVLTIAAARDLNALASEHGAGERFGVMSTAYGTQTTLAMWPLLFLLADRMPRGRTVVTFIAMFTFALLQIVFQKRLGTAAVVGLVLLYALQAPESRLRSAVARKRRNLVLLCQIGVSSLLVAMLLAPGLFIEQAESLRARIEGGGSVESGRGALYPFSAENERYQIVMECFTSFEWWEWFVGRGMGGAFEWNGFNSALLDTDRGVDLMDRYLLPDVGYYGRRQFEVGLFMPLLKGGMMLWLPLCLPLLVVPFYYRRRICRTLESSASRSVMIYQLAFLSIGGGFILSDSYGVVMLGFVFGRCLFASRLHAPVAIERYPGD